MNSLVLKILFFLFSIVIGIGCFWAFINVIIIGSWGGDFLSITIITLFIVILFLELGYKIFKSKDFIAVCITVILFSSLLTWPAYLSIQRIKDDHKKNYANSHQNLDILEIDKIMKNSEMALHLDIKTSNYETLYYGNHIRLQFEKINEALLTQKEIEELIKILPFNKNGYSVSIAFGKYRSEYTRKENSFGIFLSSDKVPVPGACYFTPYNPYNHNLCKVYNGY